MSDHSQLGLGEDFTQRSTVPPAPVLPGEEGDQTRKPRSGDSLLLQTVEVNPVALSRALVLASAFAMEYGRTPEERQRIAIFFRGSDVLLAADVDRDGSRTVADEPRPFKFRFSVPATPADVDAAAVVAGATIRIQDMIEALRNREKNSHNYGILDADTPVSIEVRLTEEDLDLPYPEREPREVVIHPTRDGSLSPRVFETLGGAALDSFDELDFPTPERGLVDLSGDAMIEMGGLADPQVGVYLDPVGEGKMIGASERGLMLATFEGWPSRERQMDMLEQVGQESAESGRSLDEPAVLSDRLAIAAGFTQLSFEDVAKSRQRNATDQVTARVMAAAVAATLDLDSEDGDRPRARLLDAAVGEKPVSAALGAAGRKEAPLDAATAFARRLAREVGDEQRERVAQALELAYGDRVGEAEQRIARGALSGESDLERLVAVYLATGSEAHFARDAAQVVGSALLREEARRLLASLPGTQDMEQLRTGDLALAAMRAFQRRAGRLTDILLNEVPEGRRREWWRTLVGYMRQLDVPREARRAVAGDGQGGVRTEQPASGLLKLPSDLREAWLRECQYPVQGQLWKDSASGRVHLGIADPSAGRIYISDTAVQPDPHAYPVSPEMAEALIAKGQSFDWKGTLWSSDVDDVTQRVVGMVEGRHDESREPEVLFVARWSPDAERVPEEDAGVLAHFNTPEQQRLLRTGEGEIAGRAVVQARNPKEPAETVDVAGQLRVFGFDAHGERLYLDLPMKARPTSRQRDIEPVAFALDARRLHDLLAFISRPARQTVLSVSDGVVRLFSDRRDRVSVVPTLGRSQVPEALQDLVAAAGVPADHGRPIEIEAMVQRLRERRRHGLQAEVEAQERLRQMSGSVARVRGAIELRDDSEADREEGWGVPGGSAQARIERLRAREQAIEATLNEIAAILGGTHDLFGNFLPAPEQAGVKRATLSRRRRVLEKERERVVQEIQELFSVASTPPVRGVRDIRNKQVKIIDEAVKPESSDEREGSSTDLFGHDDEEFSVRGKRAR